MPKPTRPLGFASRLATTSLFGAGVLGSFVLAASQPAQAGSAYTGICPVLGVTQPAYPSPFDPPTPPSAIAIPQTPVWVKPTKPPLYAGTEVPICAVYMSAADSGKKVPKPIIPDPTLDLFYPDLTLQPWYDKGVGASGNSAARDWAVGLYGNGYWDIPDTASSTPGATIRLKWTADVLPALCTSSSPTYDCDGSGLLVNENDKFGKEFSHFSPYFLRDISDKSGRPLKAEVVQYEFKPDKWEAHEEAKFDFNKPYWYWVVDAPGADAPGPLPVLGAGAAVGWSRRLRQRVKQAAAG